MGLKSTEHLKEAYKDLSRALMYRSAAWNSTLQEEALLSWAFPVEYLHHEIFPKFRRLQLGDQYEADLAYNLSIVHESKLFDYLVMPLNLKMFKQYVDLVRHQYEGMLQLPTEYYQYVTMLERKILTLYVGTEAAISFADVFNLATKGYFPNWSATFTEPHMQVKGAIKQIKTVPALYKVFELFETREWAISKIIQGI